MRNLDIYLGKTFAETSWTWISFLHRGMLHLWKMQGWNTRLLEKGDINAEHIWQLAVCLIWKTLRLNLILTQPATVLHKNRTQHLKSYRVDQDTQLRLNSHRRPRSQTLVIFYAHMCTSVQIYTCVLAFASWTWSFVFTVKIPWAYLMRFSSLLWKKYNRLDHCWCIIDLSRQLVRVHRIYKLNSQSLFVK